MRVICLIVTALCLGPALQSCQRDSNASSEHPPSIAMGLYEVSPPVCASSGQAPHYPDASYKAALFAFDGLKSHTLEVRATDVVETFQDEDCTLTITRTLARNASTEFSIRRNRKHSWTPLDCTLSVTVKNLPHPVGANYSTLFQDSDEMSEDILFGAVAKEQGYELWSADTPALSDSWQAYGCAHPDRIKLDLHRP